MNGLPDGALEGVTILDLTWVLSGPYASMVLCDLGAEVQGRGAAACSLLLGSSGAAHPTRASG